MRGGRSVTSRWTGQAREAQIWESHVTSLPSVPVSISFGCKSWSSSGHPLPMISFIPNDLPNQKEYLWKPSPREVPKATQRVGDRARSYSDAPWAAEWRQTDRTERVGAVWAGWDPSPDGGLSRSDPT